MTEKQWIRQFLIDPQKAETKKVILKDRIFGKIYDLGRRQIIAFGVLDWAKIYDGLKNSGIENPATILCKIIAEDK